MTKRKTGNVKRETPRKKFWILLCAFSIFRFTLNAAPQGAAFLKIPVGARAAGMGSAFTALVDDASAMYWNPGGLAYAAMADVTASHNQWIAETKQDFVGVAIKPVPFAAFGFSHLSLVTDPIDKRGEQGEKLGAFNAQDRAVGLSFAMKISPWAGAGASIKNIEQRIDNVTASGRALDLGIVFKPHRKFTFGASMLNMGDDMKFIKQSYALPTMLRAGAGIQLSQGLVLAVDGKQELTGPSSRSDWAVGMEYNMAGLSKSYFWSPVVWRLGYLSPQAPGIGVGMKIMGSQLDYALASIGPLGITHRVSLHLKFGGPPVPQITKAQNFNAPPAPSAPARAGIPSAAKVAGEGSNQRERVQDPRVFEWLRQKAAEEQ